VTGSGDGSGYTVRLRDRPTAEEGTVRCRAVVQAIGASTGQLEIGAQAEAPAVAPSRGTHLAVSPIVPAGAVVVAPHPKDGRFVWAVGMHDYTWLGTTDVDHPDPTAACLPEREEVAYLADWLRVRVPGCRPEIRLARAALRPLLRGAGRTRDFRCGFAANGVLVVAGGKITTHRAMAEAAVDRVVRRFFPEVAADRGRGCVTADVPLPSAPPVPVERWLENGPGRLLGDEATRRHLLLRHGTSIRAVLALMDGDRGLTRRVHPERPDVQAEIAHAVIGELARSLSDFMWRRSDLAFASDQGMAAVPVVAGRMAALLGWTRDEIARQRARYEAEVERARSVVASAIPTAMALPPAQAV
jgi:glycerol-3-phosphate dehydrogenase